MTTVNDLITDTLKLAGILGVGQTASAEDSTDAFKAINAMIAQWARRRWMVYHLIDVSFQATGAQSYTIGTGGDISATRPDQIDSAFVRLTNGGNAVDYPLYIIASREDYNRIGMKSLNSFPVAIFYDSNYPLGSVYIWPVPNSTYQVHITMKAPLAAFGALSDTVSLPAEYEEALKMNLAIRLRVAYQLPGDAMLVTLAKVALNTIKNTNTQIAKMRMPNGLLGQSGRYNIYSDTGG